MKKMRTMLLAGAAVLAAAGPAQAVDFRPDGVSLEAGAGIRADRMVGVGVVWDWDFERMRRKAELTAHTELLVNRWRYTGADGNRTELTQLVVLPTLRMRLARGASPWFLELGIGASYLDRDFVAARDRSFSTRWNFYDVLGVGHTFGGVDGAHEVALRWTHVSNAGIRNPNPGMNFLQLRYVNRF